MSTPPTAVSAPGKVLLAGGYLVLDRAYTGLVFGLSARIHVIINPGYAASEIVVRSPQFRNAQWNYGYRLLDDDRGVEVIQLQKASSPSFSRNPFVETALKYALTYVSSISKATSLKPVAITILADNDYYSHSTSSGPSTNTFSDFGVTLQDAHKTGLGSSAALVTSFTGAILSHYLPPDLFSLSSPSGQAKLHNLAQAAHCAAQGKVGSGFDVAAAVYGTCLYRRFSPSVLDAVGDAGSLQFALLLQDTVEGKASWDTEIKKDKLEIPAGVALIMCDVDCGSQTVGMVKKLLQWRELNPETANKLWGDLQLAQEGLAALLTKKKLEAGSETVLDLAASFKELRNLLQPMTERSGVPVEPPEQTKLLDTLTNGLKGVIGGVVPGAGGYDAIALLIRDDEGTMNEIKAALKAWNGENKGSNVKLLNVKGEMEGARSEEGSKYGGWVEWEWPKLAPGNILEDVDED